MWRLSFLAAALSLVLCGTAMADDALQAELAKLYQRHNDLVNADKLDEGLKLRTAEAQATIKDELGKGTKEEQAGTREMLKGMTPATFEAQHLEMTGDDAATLYGIGSKVMPVGPDKGKTLRFEMMVEFAREQGQWRIGTPTFMGDPDAVKKLADVAYEPIENFDQDKEVDLGGRIVRVALEKDHTLVVIRMLDEEQAIFLPDQSYLKEKGFNVELLKPYTVISAGGYPHKSNPQKVWGTSLSVQ